MIRAVFCVLLLAAAPASAQTRITPEDFLDRVLGKTVAFYARESGNLVGVEQFLSRELSVWRGQENKCVYGEITTPDGQVCFLYRDLGREVPTCWWPFEVDGNLLVYHTNLSRGEVQVARFEDRGLGCPESPTS
ncbi:MAG: hypothetical protein AAF218_08045 [Pseudomonadota bacterium]